MTHDEILTKLRERFGADSLHDVGVPRQPPRPSSRRIGFTPFWSF